MRAAEADSFFSSSGDIFFSDPHTKKNDKTALC